MCAQWGCEHMRTYIGGNSGAIVLADILVMRRFASVRAGFVNGVRHLRSAGDALRNQTPFTKQVR